MYVIPAMKNGSPIFASNENNSRSRNGFVAQTSLLLMQRLLDPIKTATGLDNGNQIFQALGKGLTYRVKKR